MSAPQPSTPSMSRLRTGRQAENTMAAIREFILSSNLRSGDPLPTESRICEELGVSRSSVREAMRTLAALDIVDVQHGRGTFVGNVSMQPMIDSLVFRGLLNPGSNFSALRDVIEMRLKLDIAFADEVVKSWQGGDVPEDLSDCVCAMEDCAARGELFADQDRRFHSELLAPLDNALFGQLVEAFWEIHMAISPTLGEPSKERLLRTAGAHRHMLEAACAGDVEAYRSAVIEHYQPLFDTLDSIGRAGSDTRSADE